MLLLVETFRSTRWDYRLPYSVPFQWLARSSLPHARLWSGGGDKEYILVPHAPITTCLGEMKAKVYYRTASAPLNGPGAIIESLQVFWTRTLPRPFYRRPVGNPQQDGRWNYRLSSNNARVASTVITRPGNSLRNPLTPPPRKRSQTASVSK